MSELFNPNDFEFYIPGVYNEEDQKILDSFRAELDKIRQRGPVSIADLVAGKLSGLPGVSAKPTVISQKLVEATADNYIPDNPLYSDESVARAAGYDGVPAYYFVLEPNFMPPMPTGVYFGDFMVVSGHNDIMNYYKPVYPGDELYTVFDFQDFKDITPAAGSYYRTFAVSGQAKVYNQKGELVAEGANIIKESFRRHKDLSKRTAMRSWESPDWWHQRPHHTYEGADWDYITGVWKSETVRGAQPLYWDDIEVGSQPFTTVKGPILLDEPQDIAFHLPQWAADTKKNMLDPEFFATMVKDERNLYYPQGKQVKKPASGRMKMSLIEDEDNGHGGEDHGPMPEMPPEVANRDGRSVIQNAVVTKWAATAIINWMGDGGWLQSICWDIMSNPPGYDATVIPHHAERPELFRLFPYLGRVPGMQGKRADCHGMEYDVCVIHSYVVDKYEKDGEYFIDLVWWGETIDNYIIEEGGATVKLPKK